MFLNRFLNVWFCLQFCSEHGYFSSVLRALFVNEAYLQRDHPAIETGRGCSAAYLDTDLSQPVTIEQLGLNVIGVGAALPPRYIRCIRSPAHKGRAIA